MDTIEKVLELFKRTGLKDLQLEQKIGLTRNSINNWKNRKNKISAEVLIKIADYFNVSVDYLLGRTDKKEPDSELSSFDEYKNKRIEELAETLKSLPKEDLEKFLDSANLIAKGIKNK